MKKNTFFKIQYLLPVVFIFFLTVLQAQTHLQNTPKEIDSLELRLQMTSLTDDEIYITCQSLVQAYQHIDIDKAIEYSRKNLLVAEKLKNYFYFLEIYHSLGQLYYYKNQLDSSQYYYEFALTMYDKAIENGNGTQEELKYSRMRIFVSFATINFTSGRYDLMLENYHYALDIAEEMNWDTDAAFISMSMADIYKLMTNTAQAEDYYLKGEKLYRALNDSLGIARINIRISGIYLLKEEYQKALQCSEEAYRILSALPYARAVDFFGAAHSLGEAWSKIPDYAKALKFALLGLEYARQTNRQDMMAKSLQLLAKCYLKQGKYKEADETAFQALATDSSKMSVNVNLYQIIAEANIWLKNSEKAYKYFGKSIDAINQYANENFQSSISEMEVKYETEKKEMEITALKEEKRLTNRLIFAVGGALLLGVALLFFLWQWTIQKRRLAEQQVKQLEQEKQLVATQAVFDGEVQERTRIARDLHDGLGGKLTCMKLGLQELKQIAEIDDNKDIHYKTVMTALDDSVQELRRVSHNLMPETLNISGLKAAVDEFCRNMSSKITFNYYGDETRLDINLEVQIYRCIYELVNNALKYADATQILVQIVQESDTLSFTVQDNGCGFDPTAETEGMGLNNIRTRVASVGGDIQIDSKAGEGTEVNVDFRFGIGEKMH